MAPNTHPCLFDTPFVRTYMHSLKTIWVIWMFYISNDCSTIWNISLCGLEVHEKADWKAMASDTHHTQFSDTLYGYTPYIHHYLVCNYAWQQSSHSLWLYYTPNNDFTPDDASFYENKVLCYKLLQSIAATCTYTLQCLSSDSGCHKYTYINIKS